MVYLPGDEQERVVNVVVEEGGILGYADWQRGFEPG